jgi:ribosomal protein S18 acetylase RimI-like enzyme
VAARAARIESVAMTDGVRAARPDDRAALEAAIRSDETFDAGEIAVALELVDKGLAGDPDYLLRVTERAGRVAGYVCFGRTPMTAATWDLYWVVVDAASRGQGLARELVGAMEDEIRAGGGGHVRVETSVGDGYGAARRLYEKLGYPLAATFADFYEPGDDLLVYYKPVTSGSHDGKE